ncbi:growth hormone secretagogue receptor type 1-like [Mizuhopecten yessoensis]|uniref:Mu-type opioid receptor n=1 Tax=Mizuhopecten yessoensis TaxID=6573 RepID=A0A210Q4W8_MIZYE|nr:growth hormone secretagogue receptor type 1-like [Mizuhopecten yessoensis]OWF43784.1 Mu-type opioid receptor [Mizuhopecten yessoensis]
MSNWTTFEPPDDLSTASTSLGSNPHSERFLNTTLSGSTTTLHNWNVSNDYSTTSAPNDQLLDEVGSYLWKVLSPLLFIVGIFGNTLSVIVLRRMRFWKKPSLFFLVPLAFTDTTVLCVGLSRYWVREMFDFDLRLISQAGCKINFFVLYISMQFSSWILVCFTFERFLKTNFPFRYIRIMTVKKEKLALVIIFVILVFVDGHFFFTNGLTDRDGSLDCSSLTNATFYFDEYVFVYIDLAFLSIVPAVLMIIMNICIIRVLRRSIQFLRTSSSGSSAANRQRYSIKVTKMVLLTSSYFIFATLPICLYYIVDSYTHTDDVVINAQKDLAWSVVYIFQYSNYAMNFFLYTAANDKFRLHVLGIIKCQALERFSRRKSSAYSAQHTSTFRITSEDSETVAGVSSEGECYDNHVSPSTNDDSVTGSNPVSERADNNYSVFPSANDNSVTASYPASIPSLSEKMEKSRKITSVSWSKRVQQFNSAIPNPSVSDATV